MTFPRPSPVVITFYVTALALGGLHLNNLFKHNTFDCLNNSKWDYYAIYLMQVHGVGLPGSLMFILIFNAPIVVNNIRLTN